MHAVDPVESVYVPVGQSEQRDKPEVAANFPASQSVQVEEPVSLALVPAAHTSQKEEPAPDENFPRGQSWHVPLAVETSEYDPAEHGRHDDVAES